jgi:hypothetical protein
MKVRGGTKIASEAPVSPLHHEGRSVPAHLQRHNSLPFEKPPLRSADRNLQSCSKQLNHTACGNGQ